MNEQNLSHNPKESTLSTNQVLGIDELRLLYVKTDQQAQQQVEQLLQTSRIRSYQLDITSSTEEAMMWLKKNEYHLCLLHQQADSQHELSLLRYAQSNHCHVPIVVLTEAHTFALDIEAMQLGASQCLPAKGLTPEGLEHTIRYAIYHNIKTQELRQLAEEDALTGVQNAGAFRKRLREALARAQRNQKIVALLFIDTDGFKLVNDHHGHDLGDQVLQQIASRIAQSVRETDIVGRIGGDEFAVVLEGLSNPQHTSRVCQAIIDSIGKPFATHKGNITLGTSVGISLFPEQTNDPEELLKFADQAMYHAKHKGGNQYAYFQPSTLCTATDKTKK